MVAMHRKVVARYVDGRIVRGYTFDFGPSQRRFNIFEGPTAIGVSTPVLVQDLKAVFFVRDLVGNPAHQDAQKFPQGSRPVGAHVEVRFRDGEVILGTAESPTTDPQGFFLTPADQESNNLRVYVVAGATRAVYPLEPVARTAGSLTIGAERSTRSAATSPLLPARLLSWLTR